MLRSPLERILENSGRRHRKACSSFGLTPASECLEERQLLTADVVLQWNDVLLDLKQATFSRLFGVKNRAAANGNERVVGMTLS